MFYINFIVKGGHGISGGSIESKSGIVNQRPIFLRSSLDLADFHEIDKIYSENEMNREIIIVELKHFIIHSRGSNFGKGK